MMQWEQGRPDDAQVVAQLLVETDDSAFQYVAGGNRGAWAELAAHEWQTERGIYSYVLSEVVRSRGEIQGLLIGYPAWQHEEIDWTLGSARAHLNPSLMARIDEARQIANYLYPVIPKDAFYVQNIAVASAARGTGLGRSLMESALRRARAAGCTSCHLDVDSTSPAVTFYRKLGLEVLVETRIPRMTGVPSHYRMVKDLPG
jgi:ribosomal protein S18 acetylase RimI-like enzyme